MANRYPTDEFDSVPETSKRVGAHRNWVEFPSPTKRLRPLLIVGAFVLVVGLVMYIVVRPWAAEAFGDFKKDEKQTEQPQASPSTTEEASASDTESEEPSPSESDTEGSGADGAESGSADSGGSSSEEAESEESSESPESSGSPSEDEESSEPAREDRDVPLAVYNSTNRNGMARGAANYLTQQGFQPRVAGQWSRPESTSLVYYKNEADAQVAAKVARSLGISGTYQHQNIPSDITVVLGADYTPR
ncbi:LytR C-terminal domain-containing protein [Pseudoglutamicibacter albus]|uniref:LytR C-terminal domain-containing protein n=1 Tax=Pseudoglutamicibacter albus TaxID=98671 RepID=UPI001EF58055|nr:LytR C-terminal domain-containing protein [Pseudoglutamicibacter albus]MCG7304482.1 LytR C-terminal domain-containing protein [Pseudoglutamicibacter albus]